MTRRTTPAEPAPVPADAVHGALPGLVPLLAPIEALKPMEGNPRKGDVAAVAESYRTFGQRKPIVARVGSGEVIAGNHQLAAAQSLGWTHLAVLWVEDDDKTAKAYALADNKTGDLGGYDDDALAALIGDLRDEPELLVATAFSGDEVAKFLASLDGPPSKSGAGAGDGPGSGGGLGTPVVSYQIVFDDEAQQQRWYAFIRWLRTEYPNGETLAERLDQFLASAVPSE